jgi:hypothetical protein
VGDRFTRVALLVLAVVGVARLVGRADAIAALVVIVFGFTVELGEAIVDRPKPRLRDRAPRAVEGQR